MLTASCFQEVLAAWPPERVQALIADQTDTDAARALREDGFSHRNLAALLSHHARPRLETMAQRAAALTRQRFGRAMQFYVPLYVANRCVNSCVYCGFNCRNQIARSQLTVDEAVREAEYLAREGFQHLLLVSGEDPKGVPVAYFEELASRLKGRFASLAIEIYPMSEPDYARLVRAGIDSLTIYQETYDPTVYAPLHPAGPKSDFANRLECLENGARAGIPFLGIGALLGLTDWRTEAFYVGLHAHYLQQRYWRQHVSVSFPRLRHAAGEFVPPCPVNDAALVQILTALRLQLPDAGMVLSTRESATFRDHVIPLGITRVSAGSRTTPGGYEQDTEAEGQFDVADERTLPEVMDAVRALGFDPVRKDWDPAYH